MFSTEKINTLFSTYTNNEGLYLRTYLVKGIVSFNFGEILELSGVPLIETGFDYAQDGCYFYQDKESLPSASKVRASIKKYGDIFLTSKGLVRFTKAIYNKYGNTDFVEFIAKGVIPYLKEKYEPLYQAILKRYKITDEKVSDCKDKSHGVNLDKKNFSVKEVAAIFNTSSQKVHKALAYEGILWKRVGEGWMFTQHYRNKWYGYTYITTYQGRKVVRTFLTKEVFSILEKALKEERWKN